MISSGLSCEFIVCRLSRMVQRKGVCICIVSRGICLGSGIENKMVVWFWLLRETTDSEAARKEEAGGGLEISWTLVSWAGR